MVQMLQCQPYQWAFEYGGDAQQINSTTRDHHGMGSNCAAAAPAVVVPVPGVADVEAPAA